MFNRFFFKDKERANKGAVSFIILMLLASIIILKSIVGIYKEEFSEEIKYNKNIKKESSEITFEVFRGKYKSENEEYKFISEDGEELNCQFVDNDKNSDLCFKGAEKTPYRNDIVKLEGVDLDEKDIKYFIKKIKLSSELSRYNVYAEKGFLHKKKKGGQYYVDMFVSEEGEELRCDNVFKYENADVCTVVQAREDREEGEATVIGLDDDGLIKKKISMEYLSSSKTQNK